MSSVASTCCPHTRARHGRGRSTACTRCDCTEFADQPQVPVRRNFATATDAYHYAAGAAAIQLKKWFVCKRHSRWYAIEPGMANAVRGNPNWPGVRKDP